MGAAAGGGGGADAGTTGQGGGAMGGSQMEDGSVGGRTDGDTLRVEKGQELLARVSAADPIRARRHDPADVPALRQAFDDPALQSLAGLWPFVSGNVRLPAGRRAAMFVPQLPYLPLGDLRAVASYPNEEHSVGEHSRAGPANSTTSCLTILARLR